MPRPDVRLPRRETDENATRRDDATRAALERAAPEWARGSILIGPITLAAAKTVRIAHQLGRTHRGWFAARFVCDTDGSGVTEITSGHADYIPNLADTHLQLRCNAASTLWVVAF